MSKCRTTRKWLASNYTCVSIGYCDLQSLLHFQSPDYYTCGVYGWNFDCYTFGDYAITTGYRGMISHVDRLNNSSEYELKAREILKKQWDDYDACKKEVNALLKEYLEKTFNTTNIRVYD